MLGCEVGVAVGSKDGALLGAGFGAVDGALDNEGESDGITLGSDDGALVGDAVKLVQVWQNGPYGRDPKSGDGGTVSGHDDADANIVFT